MFSAMRMNGFFRLSAGSFLAFLFSSLLTGQSAIYYVDSQFGNDTNNGTAPEQPWNSLERVNRQVFGPGDEIRLKAGTRYSGQFNPQGSGALVEGKAIRAGMYGAGPKPRIDAEGRRPQALLLSDVEFWEVADLELTNLGTNREPWRAGVHIVAGNPGAMRHILLTNLFVHDVNGDLRKEQEGCGIFFECRGRAGAHFEDLRIENCHVARTDRNGICQRGSGRTPSLGVVIRGNLLEDIGGDGIKIWGSKGALVERNVLHGGRARCEDYAAGIWPFDSEDTLIQFNEVSGMKGARDGQGFDSDYRCRRSVFQYNYSHDNDGGFMLICAPGNSFSEDAIIRYNISQNDGINSARIFHFGGGARNTQIYNNTIYVGRNQDLPLVLCGEWDGGNAQGTRFYNNIFYVDGRVTYKWDKSRDTVFENNIFYGTHVDPPADARASTNRPPLARAGSGGNGFESLTGYQWRDGSEPPLGRIVPNNGGRDFFGHPVPQDHPPCAGAAEVGRSATQ
jgi:hypothetical protein